MFSSVVAWLLSASLLPVVTSLLAEDQSACTGRKRINANRGVITSPNFPRPYSANLSCTWLITSPPSTILTLNFSAFDVTSAGDCTRKWCGCDFLLVKDQTSSRKTRYCNEYKPPAVVHLSANKLRLHFRTDAANEATGFSVTYTSRDVSMERNASEKALTVRDLPVNTSGGTPNATSNANLSFSATPGTTNISHGRPSSGESDVKPTGSRITSPLPTSNVVISPTAGNGSVVTFVEPPTAEESVDDIVVLGPSVPIVFIFIAGVLGIAWWNFMSDRQEYNRIDRYGRFWKLFRKRKADTFPPETRGVQRTASFSKKKHRDDMKEVRKHNKYSNMMRDWKGQAAATNPNLTPQFSVHQRRLARKNSFAGRLTAPRETPRPSRPASHAGDSRRMEKPVQTGQESGSTSGLAHKAAAAGSITPAGSRPPSVLLKEALSLLFNVDTSEIDKSDSKPSSKRVSFAREPVSPPETDEELDNVPLLQAEDEDQEKPALTVESRPITIPAIVVEASAVSTEKLDQMKLVSPAAGAVANEGEPLRGEQVFPDLEDFLLNLDKDMPLEDTAYSCVHHVRDILRHSYGAAEEPNSSTWQILTVPEEFKGMVRSPQHRKQFVEVEEVD